MSTFINTLHNIINNRKAILASKLFLVNEITEKHNALNGVRDKKLKGEMIKNQTEYNQMLIDFSIDISLLIYNRLVQLEKCKINGYLEPVYEQESRELYLLLCEHGGRYNSRYVKMPDEWPVLGLSAGILEDLIVVLRTPNQIGLGDKHMYKFHEFISGFIKYYKNNTTHSDDMPRFMFLTKMFQSLNNDPVAICNTLIKCIKNQGNSKRVGLYFEPDIQVNENDLYNCSLYAIQGILGNVQFDDRVTKVITLDNCNPYAVHFTKTDLALKIWNKEQTTTNKINNRTEPIYPGCICRFERPVHALSNIDYVDGKYVIYNVDKDIRTRMVHGIRKTVARPKYQAGLVIDVKKLVSMLPYGTIRQNEIGTLLINADIPHECLLYCIHEDDDIEIFWGNKSVCEI